MTSPRTPTDRGFVSLQVLAATMVVVVAVAGLLVSGVPERVSCEVGQAVTAVTGGGSPECEDTTVTAASDGSTIDLLVDGSEKDVGDDARPDAFAAGGLTAGGLTAETFSTNDSVASPAIRGAALPAGYIRCAPAPDDPATAICLAGKDPGPDGNVFTGSDVVLRCAAATATSADTCALTDTDGWKTLRTGPRDGDVRFCQPVNVSDTDAPDTPVDWACSSWAGNLHHCQNTVPTDVIGTVRGHALVGYTEPTTWVTDPDFRRYWPRTCESRTFGPTHLACTPEKATNTAACTVRGFQGLPPRPATCAYFHPRAGEDPTRSHTLTKPMHCRATAGASSHGPRMSEGDGLSFDELLRACAAARSGDGPRRRLSGTSQARVAEICARSAPGTVLEIIDAEAEAVAADELHLDHVVEIGAQVPPGAPAPAQLAGVVAGVAHLQEVAAQLTPPPGGPAIPEVPLVLVSDELRPRATVGARSTYVVVSGFHPSPYYLAHEFGHVLAAAMGLTGLATDGRAMHEGLADSFALLATGVDPRRVIPSRPQDVRFETVHTLEIHDAGVMLVNVVMNLQAGVSGLAVPAASPTWDHVILQVLLGASADPRARQGWLGLRDAMIDNAVRLGIPRHVVLDAFADQGWEPPPTCAAGGGPGSAGGSGGGAGGGGAAGGLLVGGAC